MNAVLFMASCPFINATMDRLEKQLLEVREAKLLEKRKQMQSLQEQIKEERERRLKEAKREILDEINDGHLTEYRNKLNAKTDSRERRADWRSRRMRLHNARVEFLEQEARQVILSLGLLHGNRHDRGSSVSSQEISQYMQISPDQGFSPDVCTSESLDSFDTSSVFDSLSMTALNKETENRKNESLENDANCKIEANANENNADANANTMENVEAAVMNEKMVKRPDLLSLEPHAVMKKVAKPNRHSRCKTIGDASESSGIGDVGDWNSEHSSESGGRDLILRLISEESSGRDSGMSIQTPASDDAADEKVMMDTPMSTMSNTHSSDSVISSFFSNEDGEFIMHSGLPNLRSRGRSEHGHASESTLEELLYPDKNNKQVDASAVVKQTTVVKNLPAVRLKRRNVLGHVSDSTIQNVMYGMTSISAPNTPLEEKCDTSKKRLVELIRSKSMIMPYQEGFNFKTNYPLVDMMSPLRTEKKFQREDDSVHELLPLPVVIQQSLMAPIYAQINLVNRAIYDYYMVDLQLVEHFKLLRSFILLLDGEFAQVLSDQIFGKMSLGLSPAELLNPVTLKAILMRGFNASLLRDHHLVKNFSLFSTSIPHVFPLHIAAPFEGLEVQYKVEWPINVVITGATLSKYNKLFHFLMQIRHAQWVLTDLFYHLKRNVRNPSLCPQFVQLQLFRHQMHHFIRVLQAYISNQVLQVSWSELMHDLTSDVRMLDSLHDVHAKYLTRAIFRCLLHKKAAPVMRVVQMIFTIILKFHAQMTALPWKQHPETGNLEHPSYGKLLASFRIFREYSGFLYKVMMRLVKRGYQQHLNEFLLMWNFNSHEEDDKISICSSTSQMNSFKFLNM